MFRTNDFKREEIEKSLEWNFKNEKNIQWKNWLWAAQFDMDYCEWAIF